MKKKYGIIGYPLGHSKSKIIHMEIARQCGIDISYDIMQIQPDRLKDNLDLLKSLDGFSITIPYKQQIIPYLAGMDDTAKLYMSVNTVKREQDGGMYGYNTDCIGFVRSFEAQHVPLKGSVLLLGAGGVSRTFAFESAKRGCSVTIAVRESSRAGAQAIIDEIRKNISPDIRADVCDISTVTGGYDILINGTPVGMYPNIDGCPVKDNVIAGCSVVFDAVYNPRRTMLLQKAAANGSIVIEGLPMLIYQAVAQQEIWQDKALSIDYESIAKAVDI